MKYFKNFYKNFQSRFSSDSKSSYKLLAFLLFALPFLPILPYDKKGDSFYLFGVIEGSVDNFYEIGFGTFGSNEVDLLKNPSKFDEGRALFELTKLSEKPIPDAVKHKNHLMEKGLSKDRAFCISMRDFLFNDYFYQIEATKSIHKYKPSPVPIVWFVRSALVGWTLDAIRIPAVDIKMYEQLSKRCSKYENIFPPKGYLNNDFSFPSETE